MTRNFIVGQLVATRAAQAYADNLTQEQFVAGQYGKIGRVTEIDGDKVTFKSADDTVTTAEASTLIDAVHYDISKPMSGRVGGSATIFAIDHPLLPANEVVHTSEIKFILETGMFETRNTLYMPNAIEVIPGLPLLSPYLSGHA